MRGPTGFPALEDSIGGLDAFIPSHGAEIILFAEHVRRSIIQTLEACR
jgi:hypothetical protein